MRVNLKDLSKDQIYRELVYGDDAFHELFDVEA